MRAWEEALARLEEELGKEPVRLWLRTLTLLRFDAANLYLQAHDAFQLNWCKEHALPRLKGTLKNQNGRPIALHLSLPPAPPKKVSPPLPSATFETFISSPNHNEQALRLIQEIVSLQSTLYNPLFLYGPPRSGKTHLLKAAASALAAAGARYFTAAEFTEGVVYSIRTGSMAPFRSECRSIRFLFFDNVDQLAGKPATQEEFFHTFNTLQMAGVPIVLAAPLPPSQLSGIEPRLISRFEWGLSVSLAPLPSFAPPPSPSSSLTAHALIEAVASHFGLLPSDLLSKKQAREYSYPRHIAVYLCREKLHLPLQAIGRLFQRDHSTILSSVRIIAQKITDKEAPLLALLHQIDQSHPP
jgi:chromosomal replication initiator protein